MLRLRPAVRAVSVARSVAMTRSLHVSVARFNKIENSAPAGLPKDVKQTAGHQGNHQEVPKPDENHPRRKKFHFWRSLWRLTYLSAIASLGYVGYRIYVIRNPSDQLPADPSKKTLVVLGSGWGSVSFLKKLDTSNYNVIVVSPRNYFLFTPLLPSCPTGTIEHRSIMEPIRGIIRHKQAECQYLEADATKIDHEKRIVTIRSAVSDNSSEEVVREIPFDYLVVGVGAMSSTFGIPGVQENACFLKEIPDAQQIRRTLMDCIEKAQFEKDPAVRKRLLHTVVVGGGPTGVEFAAELQDFFEDDLRKWIPDIRDDFKVTLVEALPNVLPSFSKKLIDYTEKTFSDEKISILTKTMVKSVDENVIRAEQTKGDGTKEVLEMPYGTLVWATGNTVRPVVRELMSKIPAQKGSRRGLLVNEYLVVEGTEGIWALGDCSATKYAPTAQVASQEGSYLANLLNGIAKTEDLNNEITHLEKQSEHTFDEQERKNIFAQLESKSRKLRRSRAMLPFEYSHQGSLAYIGSDRAVADLSFNFWGIMNWSSGGTMTYYFWRSAYVSMCFSMRNKILVCIDWMKVRVFGRDISRE
ncbi:External alternative NADH-ubiquinone oxidoreductase [Yarrowia sp. C11]|nr:External alternative NADH-ubiquinone oxidoreductase [Yarrowia sp. C11]KAG5364034.1 External alternative NADH-ubiquinone oxidoreductase [Yarrowia sp. E02]